MRQSLGLFAELERRIRSRTATLGVIGLGYVGVPVAALFARAGLRVIGVDRDSKRVTAVERGENPLGGEEPGLGALVRDARMSGRLTATSDYGGLADSDVITISVETPVDQDRIARFEALSAACESLGRVLKVGSLVIVESTLAPGTTDGLVRRVLEKSSGLSADRDFLLGHCPERVMPGRLVENLRRMSRVCGGRTKLTRRLMAAFYSICVEADLDLADCVTAELVKTAENAYRDLNIAFANELAVICEAVGANVWQIRSLVNKAPGRNVLLPGGGVGGHCVPKDPWLLAQPVLADGGASLIQAARRVNDNMPGHVLGLIRDSLAAHDRTLHESRVVILGYAYLEDSDDTRNSPSVTLENLLRQSGAEVGIHDPQIARFAKDHLSDALKGTDVAVLMVSHSAYRSLPLPSLRAAVRTPVIVDARNIIDPKAALAAGFDLYTIGVGHLRGEPNTQPP